MTMLTALIPNVDGFMGVITVHGGKVYLRPTLPPAPCQDVRTSNAERPSSTPPPPARKPRIPNVLGVPVNARYEFGLSETAYVVKSARGGSAGHVYLPDGYNAHRFYRPKHTYLCSTQHDLTMPRTLVGVSEVTCRACLSNLRSIARDQEG